MRTAELVKLIKNRQNELHLISAPMFLRKLNGRLALQFRDIRSDDQRLRIIEMMNEYCESVEKVDKETKTTMWYYI